MEYNNIASVVKGRMPLPNMFYVATQIEDHYTLTEQSIILGLAKNWHLVIAYSYITSLAIAVHDV